MPRSSATSISHRAIRRIAAGFTGAMMLVLAAASVVAAHDTLTGSTPATDARLSELPGTLRLTFTNPVSVELARVVLLGPDSGAIALGPLTRHPDSARVLVAPITGSLSAGRHTVVWQIAGADGHPVRGSFAFLILPEAIPPSTRVPDRGITGDTMVSPVIPPDERPAGGDPRLPSGFDAESPLYVAIRWLTFAGVLGVIGAVCFRLLVLRRIDGGGGAADAVSRGDVAADVIPRGGAAAEALPGATARAARFGLMMSLVTGIATVLRLGAQSVALQPGGEFEWDVTSALLSTTVWGTAWYVLAASVVLSAIGFAIAKRTAVGWWLSAFGALGLALALSHSGHAASAPRLALSVPAMDALHILAAGGWLGTLLVLVVAGLPSVMALPVDRRGAAASVLVAAFSPAALAFAGVLVATGVYASWVHVGLPPSLATPYGRTLAIKVALFAAVAGIGAWNWRRVRPRLGEAAVAGQLRRTATTELLVAALVLAVTAVLVATPTPRYATPTTPSASSSSGNP